MNKLRDFRRPDGRLTEDMVEQLRFDSNEIEPVIDLREPVIDLRLPGLVAPSERIDVRTLAPLEPAADFDPAGSPDAIDAALRDVQPSVYRTKRLVDLVVMAAAIVPSVFIGIAAAVAIKATSRGPVFFCQKRMGLAGEEFVCLKFRTMLDGDNPLIPDASRITGVGKWLRRFSLDELPQLINVARGEMSMVGPRPMLRCQAEKCSPAQMRRLSVRPGLTGWAQINGRNSIPWSERIDLDLTYVDQQNASFDAHIVLGTARALLSGAGVEGHDASDPLVAQLANSDA